MRYDDQESKRKRKKHNSRVKQDYDIIDKGKERQPLAKVINIFTKKEDTRTEFFDRVRNVLVKLETINEDTRK